MRVVAKRQCDVVFDGRGPRDGRKKALFPGQVYDLPEESVKALVDAGAVRVIEERVRSRAKGQEAAS